MSGDSSLQLSVARVEQPLEWELGYHLQISESTLGRFDGVSHGDYLEIQNEGLEDHEPSFFGKVYETPEISDGAVGIGIDVMVGLGFSTDSVATVSPHSPQRGSHRRRVMDSLIESRPLICRVRPTTLPDTFGPVCRLSQQSLDLLGIEGGDRVMIEIPGEMPESAKVFPIREEFKHRKQIHTENNEVGVLMDCTELYDIQTALGVDEDIAQIFMGKELRHRVGLTDKPNSGVCQPVRVYRDTWDLFWRLINKVTIPVVIGLIGALVVFRDYFTFFGTVFIFVIGLVFVLGSVAYQARRVYLK